MVKIVVKLLTEKIECASIAQAAERILGKDEVSSSNLDRSSKVKTRMA